ncbi:MAG: hypothetical protein K8F30_07390 [Taibaiella sp.]|nr:hypothetical protein [Taibaiella sp.]
MKKIILGLYLTISAIAVQAQTLADVKKAETITWYGIDYSQARFHNFGAYLNDGGVKRNLPNWSFNPVSEADIKRLKSKYKKKEIKVDVAESGKRNLAANYDEHLGDPDYQLSLDDIKKIVSEYDINGEGYGLLLVAETFKYATGKPATMWAVFINNADKSVIDAVEVSTETFGEWSEAVLNTIAKSARHMSQAK